MITTSTLKTSPSANMISTDASTSFEKYTGEWGKSQAAHLLRRTTYGSSIGQIKIAAESTLDLVVDALLADKAPPPEPINYYYEEDPEVPVGSSWINKPIDRSNNMLLRARQRSLAGWTLGNLLNGEQHIQEKLTLFWSNHFVIQGSVVQDPNFIYHHNNMLRSGAIGNFRELLKQVTIGPSMLRYLNGNQNTAAAPNENYARELLELFAIGKGALAGPGDYTTFTEEDVLECAKVLTGWRDTGYYYRDGQIAGSNYTSFRHDKTVKQLSHRFDNVTIENGEDQEFETLIDIILEKEEVSKFICRKLYRWFVYYHIDDAIENSIIEPMAEIFRENDYEIKPVLRALLSSDHFYNICSVGPMIKNPVDFIVNVLVQFEIKLSDDLLENYNIWSRLYSVFEGFGMNYYEPPNVAGWKAYYQEPLFYRTWITSATLPVRQSYTNVIVSGLAQVGDVVISMDTLETISKLENPENPNSLIEELSSFLFPNPLTEGQTSFLKEVLIPGLPDFEWTVEYNLYLNDPDNEEMKRSVDAKLRALFSTMLTLPEYYLS